jgi:hypothetical protein
MDYNHSFDSREHDSGYFTPSPDKDNKLVSDLRIFFKTFVAFNLHVMNLFFILE